MAKLTEKKILEQLANQNTDFIEEYDLQIADRKKVAKFEKEKQKAEKDYLAAKREIEKFYKQNKIEVKVEFSYSSFSELERFYERTISLNGLNVYAATRTDTEFQNKEILDVLKDCDEKFKLNQGRYLELVEDSETKEYTDVEAEIKTLSEEKNPVKALANKVKIAKLNKRLKELTPKYREFKKLEAVFTDETTVNAYNEFAAILPTLEALVNIEAEKLNEYNVFVSGERYIQNKEVLKDLKQREVDAKNFKLIKYYKQHEEEMKDTRTPLVKIYAENLDDKFLDEFLNLLRSYKQAVAIAKHEGKVFDVLPETEQYLYYDTAREIIKVSNRVLNKQNRDEEKE